MKEEDGKGEGDEAVARLRARVAREWARELSTETHKTGTIIFWVAAS